MKTAIAIVPTPASFAALWRRVWPQLRFAFLLGVAATTVLTIFDTAWAYPDPVNGYDTSWIRSIVDEVLEDGVELLVVLMAGIVAAELAPRRELYRWIWMGSAVVVSSAIAQGLGIRLHCWLDPSDGRPLFVHTVSPQRFFLGQWLDWCFPAALLAAIYEFHLQGLRAMEDAFRIRARSMSLDAELNRAQFQLLRAQIEPHFLFNTLANLRRLYGLDSMAGRELLCNLRRYLAAALPSLRAAQSSLRNEAALIGAYLDIFRVRMGSRLDYEIVFPEQLLDVTVPPMMLLTLVENAIKHGLAPLPEGGFLRLSAEAKEGVLELRVSDTGRGMGESSGHGTGLANIRVRLAAAYGAAAQLSLSLNQPRGITALVRLPLEAVA